MEPSRCWYCENTYEATKYFCPHCGNPNAQIQHPEFEKLSTEELTQLAEEQVQYMRAVDRINQTDITALSPEERARIWRFKKIMYHHINKRFRPLPWVILATFIIGTILGLISFFVR